MNKLRMLTLSVLLLTWAGSCSKNQNRVIPVEPALLQNFNFGVGTYWVYTDSASGAIDSYSITQVTKQVVPYAPNQNANIVRCDIIKDGIEAFNPGLWVMEDNMVNFYFLLTDSTFVIYSPFFIYPFTYDTTVHSAPSQYSVINFFSNLNIANAVYSNVTEIKQFGYDANGSLCNDYFYIEDTIGIVKISYNHPTNHFVLNLARYNIVR